MLLLILAISVIAIIFYPIVIEINFSAGAKAKPCFTLYWRPLGSRIPLRIPIIRKNELDLSDIPFPKKNQKKRFSFKLRELIKAIKVKKLCLDMGIGLEDAAQTALLTGGVKIILSSFFPALSTVTEIFSERPVFRVRPDFNRPGFSLDSQCILESTWGDIIIKGLKSIERNKKEE